VMLVSIMYLFGMVFMGAATGYMKDAPPGDRNAYQLKIWYGSLPITLRTLFRVISGGADWYDASACLWNVDMMYGLLFTAYIFLMVFGVLNVLVGVFVDSAMATASMDADILALEAENERRALLAQATVALSTADKDGSGTVTWEEFEANLERPEILGFLDAMQISPKDIHDVFEMVDNDQSGFVNIAEFMEGCMSLKSGANLQTIVTLLYETKAMSTQQRGVMSKLQDIATKQSKMIADVHELSSILHSRLQAK